MMNTRSEHAFRHSSDIFIAYPRWNALSSTGWEGDCGFGAKYCAFGGCFWHRLPEKTIHPVIYRPAQADSVGQTPG
jgi:hypothetical protein